MNKHFIKFLLFCFLSSSLIGCGFRLKQAQPFDSSLESLAIIHDNINWKVIIHSMAKIQTCIINNKKL